MRRTIAVCFLFVLAVSVLFASPQQWEYLVLVVSAPLSISPYSSGYTPQVTDRYMTIPGLARDLDRLGETGWELVSASFDQKGNYILTLKRQR